MGTLAVPLDLAAHELEVVFDHTCNQLLEAHLGFPAELVSRFCGVAE